MNFANSLEDFRSKKKSMTCVVWCVQLSDLFNPEENFEKSEYYGFIQSLFKDDLLSLRDRYNSPDITIMTLILSFCYTALYSIATKLPEGAAALF